MPHIFELTGLLQNQDGVVHVPFLIKGKLVLPPEVDKEKILTAFANLDKDVRYLKIPGAQIIRQPIINRTSMRYSGEYLYQILPPLDGRDLIETDYDLLVRSVYSLSVQDVLDYLKSISEIIAGNIRTVEQILELCRLTAEYPDAFLDGWLDSMAVSMTAENLINMIDTELALWGKPGRDFLDGWVEVESHIVPGLVALTGRKLFGQDVLPSKSSIRAMPTRQLHITAGNAPEIPVISAVRAILTKSAAVIKAPLEATLTNSILALAAAELPEHPITQHLSLVYWQGGDESIEAELFRPDAFDRIVVWGSPEAVKSVQSRALYTRTIYFNPRYGMSLIGREAFKENLENVAARASMDSMIFNQKACTASQVHYIEGTAEQAGLYAEALLKVLAKWDSRIPQFISPALRGRLKIMKRGKYNNAKWYINSDKEGEFASGVVVMPGEFDILDHPMCRLVVIRQVNDLGDVLKYLHQGVSTIGVYPEERRMALKDRILARGVSNVLPLGQCERIYAGMPHDGMPVLSQLVDWKNG